MNSYNENRQICIYETYCGINMLKRGSFQKAVNHFMAAMNEFNTAINEADIHDDSTDSLSNPLNRQNKDIMYTSSRVVSITSKKILAFQIGLTEDDEIVSVMLIFNLAIGYAHLSRTIREKLASTLLKQKSTQLLLLSHDVLEEVIHRKLYRNEIVSVETEWMVCVLSMLTRLGRSDSISIDTERLLGMECRLAVLQYITDRVLLHACAAA